MYLHDFKWTGQSSKLLVLQVKRSSMAAGLSIMAAGLSINGKWIFESMCVWIRRSRNKRRSFRNLKSCLTLVWVFDLCLKMFSHCWRMQGNTRRIVYWDIVKLFTMFYLPLTGTLLTRESIPLSTLVQRISSPCHFTWRHCATVCGIVCCIWV